MNDDIYRDCYFVKLFCDLNIFESEKDTNLGIIMNAEEYENSNLEEIFYIMDIV